MKLKKGPLPWEERTVKRFAWFPIKLTNGDRIWLEHYFSREGYARYRFDISYSWFTLETYKILKSKKV
jgi:hypothetical protein